MGLQSPVEYCRSMQTLGNRDSMIGPSRPNQPFLARLPLANLWRNLSISALMLLSFGLVNSFTLPDHNLTYTALQNVGHFALFVVLGFLVLSLWLKPGASLFRALVLSTICLVALGVAVELVQKGIEGRTASRADLILDAIGIAVGYLVLLAARLRRHAKWGQFCLVLGGICVTTLVVADPLIKLVVFDVFRPSLPIVRSFDYLVPVQKLEAVGSGRLQVVTIERPDASNVDALRVEFSTARYGGVIFHEDRAGWGNYAKLRIEIVSTLPDTRQIEIRINDRLHNNRYHDRYNGAFSVTPGFNELIIPIEQLKSMGGQLNPEREMDIDEVSQIQIFASENENRFVLDIVRIELLL